VAMSHRWSLGDRRWDIVATVSSNDIGDKSPSCPHDKFSDNSRRALAASAAPIEANGKQEG
jgi:hypothetical protein